MFTFHFQNDNKFYFVLYCNILALEGGEVGEDSLNFLKIPPPMKYSSGIFTIKYITDISEYWSPHSPSPKFYNVELGSDCTILEPCHSP